MSGYQQQQDDSLPKFNISKNELCDFFNLDNIKDGISTQNLKKMKGAAGLLENLKSNVEQGLQNNNLIDKSERVIAFGRNDPVEKPPKTLWTLIVAVFEDFMLRLISVAAIVSLIIGICKEGVETGWMEGVTIIFAVVLIVTVSAGNDYLKEKQFAKLTRKLAQRDIEVTRDGKPINIPIEEILVGDIFTLGIGEIVPVDGVLVAGSQLMMDESSITGESDLIEKTVIQPGPMQHSKESGFIISGSKVMDGTGKMVVCAVGESSFNGKMKLTMQEEADPTPLQMKLETVANDIGKLGILVAALVIIALLGHLIYKIIIGEQELFTWDTAGKVVDPLLLSITIIVMAVPEGLPLAVTISLAYSVNKMKDEQNLVRTLASCEIMGGANNICSDKTGTLTQNLMTATQLYFEGINISTTGIQTQQFNKQNLDILGALICVNSQANPIKVDGIQQQLGNKTECALLELVDQLGYNYQDYRPSQKILKIFPFSSARKRMVVAYDLGNGKVRIFAKGASEIILGLCNYELLKNGQVQRMDKQKANYIEQSVILNFAQQSLRTIGMAYKDIDSYQLRGHPETWSDEELSENLTFVAIAGIKDPLRPSIKSAIEKCKTAGITVRMVTGDNIVTAIAIAKECGILPENYQQGEGVSYKAMQGKQFRELVGEVVYDIDENGGKRGRVVNMDEFRQVARDLRVLARSSPQDKYTLVTGLKQLDNVVAVTGDGTNDAPALKKADVGFAMGIAGTEVAKEAAGIILLDDNFNSIVTACKWGRNIFDSIRKFLQFQLTINIVALIMALVGSIVLESSPLNAIQMLWVNLIMDTFAALALATEPPNESLLKRQPYGKKEYIVTPNMWRNIVGQAVYQIVILNIILFMFPSMLNISNTADYVVEKKQYSEEHYIHYTIFFQTFVLLQLFNQINCRKLKREEINIFAGLCNNPLFWIIEIITLIVQILLIEVGGQFVKVSPLTVKQHIYCLVLGFFSIAMGFLIKLIPNALFNFITLFREVKPMDVRTLNTCATSVFRKSRSQLSETLIRKSSKEKEEPQPKWFQQKYY